MKRETRLIDKSTFDDPNSSCLAGSDQEFELIYDWERVELVYKIQELDEYTFELECRRVKYMHALTEAIESMLICEGSHFAAVVEAEKALE